MLKKERETVENKKIAILLAIYEPREDWLIELLESLNGQTYPSLSLYVRDDASPTYPIERLRALLSEHITKFPFTLNRNESPFITAYNTAKSRRVVGTKQLKNGSTEDIYKEYPFYGWQDDIV